MAVAGTTGAGRIISAERRYGPRYPASCRVPLFCTEDGDSGGPRGFLRPEVIRAQARSDQATREKRPRQSCGDKKG